jgi:hypothetical protein
MQKVYNVYIFSPLKEDKITCNIKIYLPKYIWLKSIIATQKIKRNENIFGKFISMIQE